MYPANQRQDSHDDHRRKTSGTQNGKLRKWMRFISMALAIDFSQHDISSVPIIRYDVRQPDARESSCQTLSKID